MPEHNNELTAWDRDHFFHPSTHMGMHARGETPTRIIAGGEGVHITDTNGKTSLDAFAGLYCVNVGYGRQKISDAIAEQAHRKSVRLVKDADLPGHVKAFMATETVRLKIRLAGRLDALATPGRS